MCGISALFLKRPGKVANSTFRMSLEKARHRGPDGQGFVFGRSAETLADSSDEPFDWALGHARLAIVDLSTDGIQPMAYGDRRLWLTFNGEIYNYLELRSELRALGFRFKTQTDSEVLLAAYSAWGPVCVERLVGMFALVIVDLTERRVFVARDRLGIKPLYVWQGFGGAGAAIVSEPKQLHAYDDFSPKADRELLLDFLCEGVVGHVADRSCFVGVRPLPPATCLSFQLGDTPCVNNAVSYWTPSTVTQKMDEREARESTVAVFRESIRVHLRADVPVGACLSGGIDSSSIVGVVAIEHGIPIHTFSSCSTDPRFDEQPYIDAVTQHCRTLPEKVFPSEEDCLAQLDRLVYHQDEPFGSLSLFAQWSVMEAARRAQVPVMLDGQGGDEALCGYRKFAFYYLRQLWRRRNLPQAARSAWQFLRHGDGRLFDARAAARYLPVAWSPPRAATILRVDAAVTAEKIRRRRVAAGASLHEQQWNDLAQWSLPALLRYEDRNSMAHGIEARVPFVDHRFVEHCLQLPESAFFQGGRTKRVLVDPLGGSLPSLVRNRRTKMGFETPQAVWMAGRIGEVLEDRIAACEPLAEIIDIDRVSRAFAQLRAGQPTVPQEQLFRIGSAALWFDKFAASLEAA